MMHASWHAVMRCYKPALAVVAGQGMLEASTGLDTLASSIQSWDVRQLPSTSHAYSSGTSDAAMKSAEKLLELMSSSPALQQMMSASLPPHMRNNPDLIKIMLQDPGVKQKMVEMIAKQGGQLPTHVLERMNAGHMEETMNRLKRVGIDPTQMPQKLQMYPGIFKSLQDPKVMQAFLETAENPAAAYKYDEDVLSVVRKAQEVLRTRTPAQEQGVQNATVLKYTDSTTATTSISTPSPPVPGPVPPPLSSSVSVPLPASPRFPGTPPPPAPGDGPIPFIHKLGQDPALAAKLQIPRVQKALEEISKSPWKTIKYVFDKDVMEVFTALNKMLKTGGKK